MKKIFLSLIIIVVLFAATGCGKSTNNSASSELIINGEKIKINEIGTLNDLNYKYSDDFNVESQSSGVNITYIKDTPQFKISLTYAENGSIEDAIKLLAVDEGSKVKINGVHIKKMTILKYTKFMRVNTKILLTLLVLL